MSTCKDVFYASFFACSRGEVLNVGPGGSAGGSWCAMGAAQSATDDSPHDSPREKALKQSFLCLIVD